MKSILSNAQIAHFTPWLSDDEGRIAEQLELIAKEIRVMQERRGVDFSRLDDLDNMLQQVRTKMGDRFVVQLSDAFADESALCQDAGFLLGYYTAKHPEWLIFRQDDDE